MQYDSAEIRLVAKQLKRDSGNIDEGINQGIRPMLKMIQYSLEGNTADALTMRLDDTRTKWRDISDRIKRISQELMIFAKQLEDADEMSKRIIQQ